MAELERDERDAPKYVPIGPEPILVGRSSQAVVRLSDPTISRRHATLCQHDEALEVVDHGSCYGTFVNGIRVRTVRAQPGDRLQFRTTVVYRFQGGGLELDVQPSGARIDVAGLPLAITYTSFQSPLQKYRCLSLRLQSW